MWAIAMGVPNRGFRPGWEPHDQAMKEVLGVPVESGKKKPLPKTK
jgi:hypothetical protein